MGFLKCQKKQNHKHYPSMKNYFGSNANNSFICKFCGCSLSYSYQYHKIENKIKYLRSFLIVLLIIVFKRILRSDSVSSWVLANLIHNKTIYALVSFIIVIGVSTLLYCLLEYLFVISYPSFEPYPTEEASRN